MAYDESPLRRHDADVTDPTGHQAAFGDPALRDGPDYRTMHHAPAGAYREGGPMLPATAGDGLDDPAGGADGGRDRLGVHWAWEMVLLLGVGVLFALLWQAEPAAVRGDGLSRLLAVAAGIGLLGLAAGVSLRAVAPNLAIGPVAAAAGVYFAERGAEGVLAPTTLAVVFAAAAGVAVALLVVGLQVPGWAASLAAAAGVVVWLEQQPAQVPLSGAYDPTDQALAVFVVVVAFAAGGGLLATVAPVRRVMGRSRPARDPAARQGVLAALATGAALVVSMTLAVVGGVMLAASAGVPAPGSTGIRWLELTVVGVAVALLGGTSAFGRRGGVFGTVLAALAFVLFDAYQQAQGWDISPLASGAVVLAGGLLVTRLVERLARPVPPEPDDDWAGGASMPREPAGHAADAWSPADAWTSALPAQPAPDNPWRDRWSH